MEHKPPPPPYALSQIELLNVFVTFHPDAVRQYVPSGIELTDDCSGGFRVYSAPLGHGIAPYTAGLAFVDVVNRDSADGTQALFSIRSCFSSKAYAAFRTYFDTSDIEGHSLLWNEGDLVVGESSSGSGSFHKLVVRPLSVDAIPVSGVNYYLYKAASGGLRIIPCAFSTLRKAAEPVSVEIGDVLRRICPGLRINEYIRASFSRNVSFTLGQSIPYASNSEDLFAEESKVGILNILSDLNKGAALVDRRGRILFINAVGKSLTGDGIEDVGGFLKTSRRQDQGKLDEAIADAVASTSPDSVGLRPIAVERPSGKTSLLIKPLLIGSRKLGGPVESACVLLITDPDQQLQIDVSYSLQLLGLTPAEARIASLVGSGLGPQQVATRVGNTEQSVRVTLSRVFDKLDLSRQGELAAFVGRLHDVAT